MIMDMEMLCQILNTRKERTSDVGIKILEIDDAIKRTGEARHELWTFKG